MAMKLIPEKNLTLWAERMTTNNAVGLCSQKWCDKEPEYFIPVEVNGQELLIVLCKEHAAKIEEFVYKQKSENSIMQK